MTIYEAVIQVSASWRHCILSVASVDMLYNYKERITPEGFEPDDRLTAFRVFTTEDSPTPHFQRLGENSAPEGPSFDISFESARRPVRHILLSDIIGLRLNQPGGAASKWDNRKSIFCDLVERKPRFAKALSEPNYHPTGVTPLWVLRSFFIGPDIRRCPPYITVLCSEEKLSRDLVDFIRDDLKKQFAKNLQDWGVTRLPSVQVSGLGSQPGSPGSSGEEFPQNEEEDNGAAIIRMHLMDGDRPFTMPNYTARTFWDKQQHKCGIRLSIFQGSRLYRHATLGGLIQVGEKIFGLTVCHVLPIVDPARDIYSAQSSGVEEQQQDPSTAPTDQTSDTIMDDNNSVGGMWHDTPKQSIDFDWGLVEMPALEAHQQHPDSWNDVNLVQTMSGDFRPVLVAPAMPVNGTPVVLATPGSALCLRGIITGEDALVNMPGSNSPYIAWVLRMEQPWLIRSGDSGSWAFEAGSGDLLGILVAGCPELHEAYIIPAYQVFGDIRRTIGKDVKLPNCYPISEQDHQELTRLEESILGFKADLELREIMNDVTVFNFERIKKETAPWLTQAQAAFSNDQRGFLTYRGTDSRWISPRILQMDHSNEMRRHEHNTQSLRLASESLTSDERQLCEDILRRSPLDCFNFVLHKLRESVFKNPDIKVPALLWLHLILGEHSLMFSESDFSTAGYHISQVIEDERRSCANYCVFDLPRDRSSIMEALARLQRSLDSIMSTEKRYCYATLPQKAHFDLENVDNPQLLVAVLMNEAGNRMLVLDRPLDRDRRPRFLELPCIPVGEALSEEESLQLLLGSKMGLENMSYEKAQKLELDARNSRFWLEGHNIYVDVAAYKVVLSDEEWNSTSSHLYEMDVVGIDPNDVINKVSGWHYIRILQLLGYRFN